MARTKRGGPLLGSATFTGASSSVTALTSSCHGPALPAAPCSMYMQPPAAPRHAIVTAVAVVDAAVMSGVRGGGSVGVGDSESEDMLKAKVRSSVALAAMAGLSPGDSDCAAVVGCGDHDGKSAVRHPRQQHHHHTTRVTTPSPNIHGNNTITTKHW